MKTKKKHYFEINDVHCISVTLDTSWMLINHLSVVWTSICGFIWSFFQPQHKTEQWINTGA